MSSQDIEVYRKGVTALLQSSSFILFVEVPVVLILTLGVIHWWLRDQSLLPRKSLYKPLVSCVITCYNEGSSVQRTLKSLCEQIYEGAIELIVVVDGAAVNSSTLDAVRHFRIDPEIYPRRHLHTIAKWQRGGRVSSLNAGLAVARGEIVMALDGDTSFDNTMTAAMVRQFEDPDVQAVAGNLRVRNTWESLATALQALEYLLSIGMARIGLAEWNLLNIVSGACGAFRRSLLIQLGGWDTHTSEDLDITLRIKNYFKRHPNWRIAFAPKAIGHTDAPSRFADLLKQRLRWDGDLLFVYGRKHKLSMAPGLIGWPNFLATVFYGFFVQIIQPFIILIHSSTLLVSESWGLLLPLAITIYGAYLLLSAIQFLTAVMLCSERPRRDLRLMPVLLIFPLAMFVIRCWSAVALLNELLRRGHEESSMAPWWVIRRANRF